MSKEASSEKPKRVYDVDVNRAALKKAGSLDEFTKLNPDIFDHLGVNESAAYAELWKEGVYTTAPATPAKAVPAASEQTK